MKSLGALTMIIFMLLSHYSQSETFNDIRSVIRSVLRQSPLDDCSHYANDEEIFATFPFFVDIRASSNDSKKTFAWKNKRGHIKHLKVANERYLPSSVFCLTELEELHVHNTNFQGTLGQLPAAIDHLASSLTHLSIHDTLITELPATIGKLKRLQFLTLSNTGLRSLPKSISRLISLVYLNLQNNQLTALPATIVKTPSLQTLVLDDNKQLRTVQSLDGHRRLTVLHTENCRIERIPINLPQLMHLYMANNSLTNLNGIQTLGNETDEPKTFFLYKNFIRFVTPYIQRVNNLQRLVLDRNKLDTLPSSIYNIPALEYLFIKNNYFNDEELEGIVATFNITHPNLQLYCRPQRRT